MGRTTAAGPTLATLMVLGQLLAPLLVVVELGLVRKAGEQGSQVQIPLDVEGREALLGDLAESGLRTPKRLRAEV